MDDSIYRLRLQDLLGLCVLGLMSLGVLMVSSAAMNIATRWVVVGTPPDQSTPQTYHIEAFGEAKANEWAIQQQIDIVSVAPDEAVWQWNDRGTRHAMYVAGAILIFIVVARLDIRRFAPVGPSLWGNLSLWGVILAAGLCAATLVPGIGHEVNGARRWIKLGPIQLQPSEIAKWAVVLHLAWWLTAKPQLAKKFFTGVLPLMIPVAALSLLVVIQDFGTAALIGLVAVLILVAAGMPKRYFAIIVPPALVVAGWFVMAKEYRLRRLTSFLNPFENPQAEGYHMVQSLLSFANGGISGRGVGNGVQKLGYLPEDTTDFIFAVICEELGLFGAVLVVMLFLGILFVAWRIARRTGEPFGRLLAFGIGAMVVMQAVINLAVATVSVPTKGLSLPLVSAGGTGLLITSFALGVLCSIARTPRTRLRPAPAPVAEPQAGTLIDESILAAWTSPQGPAR